MNSKKRIKKIIAGEPADRCGFWMGNPHEDSVEGLFNYFKTDDMEEIRKMLNDDLRWVTPQFTEGVYQSPDGTGIFYGGIFSKKSHGQPGPLANCEDPAELENFPWPNPDWLHFDNCLEILSELQDYYVASGFWTCFYHNIMDLFGMENYMLKMYTNPEVVLAVTDKVCEFYYEANERFYDVAGNLMDGFFFGNDFGTQRDLICSPEMFDQFIMPWFKKFIDQAHSRGYQVILHSCGAIHKVIGRLIDAGVECLHPLQAKAANMDAETLAKDFKGKISFLGGIDTQDLLVNASPEEVMEEVRRVKKLLGPNLIVSPSHEAILPNVPPENIEAMAKATVE